MATFDVYRTARTAKHCQNYPRCTRGIQPGERYLRASATPHDEVNQSEHWWTLTICCACMRPEREAQP